MMPILKRKAIKSALFFLFFFWLQGPAFSQEHSLKTKYFTVYYTAECDLSQLAERLRADKLLHIDIFTPGSAPEGMEAIISELFDSLYLEVSDIIDIHMYSFEGTIKILSGRRELGRVLSAYFKKVPNVPSFYSHANNTLYLSWPDLTLGMLAHEMAHAIISHYFVVPPSAKVQEILSGYVEYSIRKKIGIN